MFARFRLADPKVAVTAAYKRIKVELNSHTVNPRIYVFILSVQTIESRRQKR